MNKDPGRLDPLSFSPEERTELQAELLHAKLEQAAPRPPAHVVAAGLRALSKADAASPVEPVPEPGSEDDATEVTLPAAEAERAQQQVQVNKPPADAHALHAADTSPPTVARAGLSAAVLAAVAREIAAGRRHDRPSRRTVRGIHAEVEQLRRKLMQEAQHPAVRIPKRADKVRSAICTLLWLTGEGKVLSARRAVWEAGLAGNAGAKLAYRVRIETADVIAATCLMQQAPFVLRLREDAGWLQQVTSKHRSLSALAKTLGNARRSFAGGSQPRINNDWHQEARVLRAAGWSGNRIARHFGLNVKTVESFIRRERLKPKLA